MVTVLDIEGAFDRTPAQVICENAIEQGRPKNLLYCRHVSVVLGNVVISGMVTEGGITSATLGSLLANRLLTVLNVEGIYA